MSQFTGTVLTEASRQWATRPDDQRYTTMAALKEAVAKRRTQSWTAAPKPADLKVLPQYGGGLGVEVFDPTAGQSKILTPSHWSFNQLAQAANAPAGYLRKLPAELAATLRRSGVFRRA